MRIWNFRRIEAPDAFFGMLGARRPNTAPPPSSQGCKRILGLRFRRSGEEIAFRKLLEGAAQALHQCLSPA